MSTLLFLALIAFSPLAAAMNKISNPTNPTFSDVTAGVGVKQVQPKFIKYGGPTIADLDGDGYPDMLFVHHDQHFAEIYFNQRNGKFIKSPWQLWTDMHGINVVPESVWSKRKLFTVSSGGAYGLKPTPPRMFRVDGRSITEITEQAGVDKDGGRGRTTLFIHLKFNKNYKNPDMVVTNAKPNDQSQRSHFAYYNNGPSGGNPPTYQLRPLPNYQFHWNSHAMAADIDGDGQMEMITYQNFTVYKFIGAFLPQDITFQVMPANMNRRGIVGIAEFDYDNDGDMDLYVARTATGDLSWLTCCGSVWPDMLLENQGGKYVDVGVRAGIPRNTQSRGVTVGDFNNDGFIDVFVTQYDKPDIMLLNRGDGTFKWVQGLVGRPGDVRGDNAQAVDYDMDGRLDLIVSQGDQFNRALGGSYRVLKNNGKKRRWLLVRVGTAPDRSATSLHAIVKVETPTGMVMTRRVGSVGDNVARSMIETVHFGMRGWKTAKNIKVTWISGVSRMMTNVGTNKAVTFGIV